MSTHGSGVETPPQSAVVTDAGTHKNKRKKRRVAYCAHRRECRRAAGLPPVVHDRYVAPWRRRAAAAASEKSNEDALPASELDGGWSVVVKKKKRKTPAVADTGPFVPWRGVFRYLRKSDGMQVFVQRRARAVKRAGIKTAAAKAAQASRFLERRKQYNRRWHHSAAYKLALYRYYMTARKQDTGTRFLMPVHTLARVCPTAADVSRHVWFEERVPLPPAKASLMATSHCYACKASVVGGMVHGFYSSMCVACGDMHYEHLMMGSRMWIMGMMGTARRVCEYHALVIGARTKIGYQTAVRLLRAGLTVVATTRHPQRCVYAEEPDYASWAAQLTIVQLDLGGPDVEAAIASALGDDTRTFDVVIHVAAQTVRVPQDDTTSSSTPISVPKNQYGDPARYYGRGPSSWEQTLFETPWAEIEEVLRVNVLGAAAVARWVWPRLKPGAHYITAHAKEGLHSVHKTPFHAHTNIAKAGQHMLTRMLQEMARCEWAPQRCRGTGFRRHGPCARGEDFDYCYASRVRVYGIDPGWVSLDEYRPDCGTSNAKLPLSDLDAAAKLTHALFRYDDEEEGHMMDERGDQGEEDKVRRYGTVRHYNYEDLVL